MSEGIKKCCQCCWCSQTACCVGQCIDCWHSLEACGLAYINCNACCWTMCAPICIDCKCGDTSAAMDKFVKGIKYCVFACALDCVAVCDGIYNCIKVIGVACDSGIKTYGDLTKNSQFIANKVKESLGLETGNEPLKSMGSFTP